MRKAGWRGFGRREDLDLDFSEADRPALVTRLLCACSGQPSDADALWSLTLAERIGALLRILALGEGTDALALQLRCPACGESLEVAVPQHALLDEAQSGAKRRSIEVPLDSSDSIRLRRPTGEDQRRWRARRYASQEEAVAAIAASLALSAPASGEHWSAAELQRMSEAMEAFDPLVAFQVTTACPGCGAESTVPVELEAELLARLGQCQQRLLEQVHRLAAFYGWTEEEVLAVPAWRRERYLRMIQRGTVQ